MTEIYKRTYNDAFLEDFLNNDNVPAPKKSKSTEQTGDIAEGNFYKDIINEKLYLSINCVNFTTPEQVTNFFQQHAYPNMNIRIFYPTRLSVKIWDSIVEEIKSIQPHSLELSGCDFEETAPYEKLACEEIKKNLRELIITYDSSVDAARGISLLIQGNFILEKLHIEVLPPGNPNIEDDLVLMAEALSSSHIKTFRIDHYVLSSHLVKYLAHCLQKSEKLQELILTSRKDDSDEDLTVEQPNSVLADWKAILHNPHLRSIKIRHDVNSTAENTRIEQQLIDFFDQTTSTLETVDLSDLELFEPIKVLLANHYNLSEIRLKRCSFTKNDIIHHLESIIIIPEKGNQFRRLIFGGTEQFFKNPDLLEFCVQMNSRSLINFDFKYFNPLAQFFCSTSPLPQIIVSPTGSPSKQGQQLIQLQIPIANSKNKIDEICNNIRNTSNTPAITSQLLRRIISPSFSIALTYFQTKAFQALTENKNWEVGQITNEQLSLLESVAQLYNREAGHEVLTIESLTELSMNHVLTTLKDTSDLFYENRSSLTSSYAWYREAENLSDCLERTMFIVDITQHALVEEKELILPVFITIRSQFLDKQNLPFFILWNGSYFNPIFTSPDKSDEEFIQQVYEALSKKPLTASLLNLIRNNLPNLDITHRDYFSDQIFREIIESQIKGAKVGKTSSPDNSLFESLAQLQNREWGADMITAEMMREEINPHKPNDVESVANYLQRPIILYDLNHVEVHNEMLTVTEHQVIGKDYPNTPFLLYITPSINSTAPQICPIFRDL